MESFEGNKIIITGGLGFLGSSLAVKLSQAHAKITIIDNLAPLYGANYFNLNRANKKNINIIIGDIRNKYLVKDIIKNSDIIFHFAAQVSYIDSLNMPYEDLEINVTGTLNILESIRKYNKDARLFFASSRMVLGPAVQNKINEDHPTKPISLYGIHKLTSENYLLTYHKNFAIRTTIFRITNPYGPKQQIKHSKYSLVGWFIRQAMEDKTIEIFGEGKQKRDYIYVDDIINAIIQLTKNEYSSGEIFNVGFGKSTEFREMVKKIIEVVGKGKIAFVDWPENYENIETGNIQIDISKIIKHTGWKAKIDLEEGIKRTFLFYSKYFDKYVK